MSKVRAAVTTTEVTAAATPHDPMYAVALLKIALELKRDPAAGVEATVERIVSAMGFPADSFRRYVEGNLALLTTTARARGY